MANFSLDPAYIDVATRIVEFRTKHPEGSLQQVKYELITAGPKVFIAYTAAAYRTPDDPRPGMGTAWEPVPGPTSFTKDSEMQNAETAAWGRAIVAVLAADTNRNIASAEEVRNRQAAPQSTGPTEDEWAAAKRALWDLVCKALPNKTQDQRIVEMNAPFDAGQLSWTNYDDILKAAEMWK